MRPRFRRIAALDKKHAVKREATAVLDKVALEERVAGFDFGWGFPAAAKE